MISLSYCLFWGIVYYRIRSFSDIYPFIMAYILRAETLFIPNLDEIFLRWVSTVLMLIANLSAISLLIKPIAISFNTSISRGESSDVVLSVEESKDSNIDEIWLMISLSLLNTSIERQSLIGDLEIIIVRFFLGKKKSWYSI